MSKWLQYIRKDITLKGVKMLIVLLDMTVTGF
jgi:hypothetical protein